jgi:hypothetical protein
VLKREKILYIEDVFPKVLLADVRILPDGYIPLRSTPQVFHHVSIE